MPLFTPSDEFLARLTLGAMIRSARESRGLLQSDLARRSHTSQPDVSNIETGSKTIDTKQITQILDALEIPEQGRVEFMDQFRLLAVSPMSYRYIQTHGVARKQDEIGDYERAATKLSVYEPTLIPGLLQTARYARELFGSVGVPAEMIDDAVEGRLRRQRIIVEDGRAIHILMAEAALYSAPTSASVRQEQLRLLRLHVTTDSPRVGVIPTVHGFPPRTGTAFIVVNDALVSAETVVAEQQITDPEDVRAFVNLHKCLASRAVYGETARALVDGAIAHFA